MNLVFMAQMLRKDTPRNRNEHESRVPRPFGNRSAFILFPAEIRPRLTLFSNSGLISWLILDPSPCDAQAIESIDNE